MPDALAGEVPVLGFAAPSGTGKTTLLAQVLPLLAARGLRVGMVKHAHHSFDTDHPGKDSFVLRKAGARQMLIASDRRWALMVEHPMPQEPRLAELIARLDTRALDLVLVEGFKHEAFPKIELHRPSLGLPPLFLHDPDIIAVATDAPIELPTPLPRLDLNAPLQVAELIMGFLAQGTGRRPP